jgi:hypothetical protein
MCSVHIILFPTVFPWIYFRMNAHVTNGREAQQSTKYAVFHKPHQDFGSLAQGQTRHRGRKRVSEKSK